MRLLHEFATLLSGLREYTRWLLTGGRWDPSPIAGHLYEETPDGWRCACGAVTT